MSFPLFEYGTRRLDEIVRPGMLCAFDFDGTLAPIVQEPAHARIPVSLSRRLVVLSEYVRVAIISGRSVEDLGLRLDFMPDFIVGNHGIEGVPGWEGAAQAYRQLCLDWEQRLSAALVKRGIVDPGIWIENKTYSLSVHYRMARNQAQAESLLGQVLAQSLPDAYVAGGKCVFNLVPPGASDKGVALARLIESSGAPSALYVGDDISDEDAFSLRRDDVLTVRIENAVSSAADFYLHHQLEMAQLLDELIARLAATNRQGR